MSAYGAISRPVLSSKLPTTTWPHPRDPHAAVTLFHLDPSTLVDLDEHPGLFEHLHTVFADEVDTGLTYPQEDMRDPVAFGAYFCAADVVIAVLTTGGPVGDGKHGITPDPHSRLHPLAEPAAREDEDGVEVEVDLETARAERSWDACVVGFYYVCDM